MEVLGDDEAAGTRLPSVDAIEEPLVELDLGSTAGAIDVPESAPDDAPGALRSTLAAALAGESLALAGLVIAFATLVGGYFGPITMVVTALNGTDNGPKSQVQQFATVMAASGVIGLILSSAGLGRMRADAPGWARAVGGAGVLVGAFLLAVAAMALWRSTGLPATYGPTG